MSPIERRYKIVSAYINDQTDEQWAILESRVYESGRKVRWLGEQLLLHEILTTINAAEGYLTDDAAGFILLAQRNVLDAFILRLEQRQRNNGELRQFDEVFKEAGWDDQGLRHEAGRIQIVEFLDDTCEDWAVM